MPSKLPKVNFVLQGEDLDLVRKYQSDNHIKSLSKAFVELVTIGLDKEQKRIAAEQTAKSKKQPTDDELPKIEDGFFTEFHSLPAHQKALAASLCLAVIRELSKHCENVNMEAAAELSVDVAENIIPFRRSNQPASAGTGMYLGPDEFETIYVLENDLTRRASFGIPVSGESMEPDYHNGDMLLVERVEDIAIGEVGVFTIDGQGYVKERGVSQLFSVNPAYAPIPMNESIRCNGRVIGILKPEWVVER